MPAPMNGRVKPCRRARPLPPSTPTRTSTTAAPTSSDLRPLGGVSCMFLRQVCQAPPEGVGEGGAAGASSSGGGGTLKLEADSVLLLTARAARAGISEETAGMVRRETLESRWRTASRTAIAKARVLG